ncbi:MAG TPA: flavin reductase family protein [Caulobacteraceae bacterium]|nr:flavin reductase family protein [Caulobacteraceae bacterium]
MTLQTVTSPPTAAEWRAAMGYFPTGVTIVTTWDGEEPVGSTINAFCSVSLDPPLLLICLDLKNPIREAFERSKVFGVNILGADCRGVALRFAREPLTDRFSEFAWRAAPGGAPQLDAAPVFVDCVLQDLHMAGDHLVAIGRGVRTHIAPEATPLLYHRGKFPTLGPA